MKLKTYVKHCIMQYPLIYRNALDVYNHLFYVIGNGYEWKNGVLHAYGFKTKSKLECIKAVIDEHIDSAKKREIDYKGEAIFTSRLSKQDIEDLIIMSYKGDLKRALSEIEIVENAEKLAEDFTPQKDFKFYPICQYSKCMNIPEDVQPDWLEGINKINEFRKQHPELEIDPNVETGWK